MDKGLLKRALQDSEEPTPGYMYRDIVKWTFLDVNTQNKLIAAIMERLKPNASVHILTKTLKLVKHLCENGHSDFQKEMQRNSDTLKQFANYRGSQDAKYGDKLNERVRNAAREAVDTAFAPRKENKISIDSGHGSNSAGFNDNTAPSSQGFKTGERVNNSSGGAPTGDARIANMPTGNKWAEHMARGGGPVKDENDSGFGSQISKAVSSGFGMKSQEKVKTEKEKMTEKLHDMGEYQAIDIAPSFGGGGAGGGFSGSGNTGSGGGDWKFTDEANGTGAVPEKKEVRMVTPLQKEVERVAAFKNTPQRVEVTQFCENIAKIVEESDGTQTYEDLAEFMDANISQKHPWQARLNVLCCIEGIVRSKVSEGDFNQYFMENPEDIQRNVHVVQGSLKERATKVMKLLNIPERTTAGTTTANTMSLATSAGETTWSAPVAPVPTVSSTENADGGELDFGGMSETAPRRKKKDGAGAKDKTSLKKRAAITTDDSNTGGGWGNSTGDSGGWGSSNTTAGASSGNTAGGGWGGGWGDNNTTTTASSATGGDAGWGAPATTTSSAPAPTTTAPALDPFGNPTTSAPTQQAPPAQKPADDFDALFAPSGNPTLNTTGKPQPVVQPPTVWGADSGATSAPAKQEPVWGAGNTSSSAPAQSSGTSFDPLSLPAANPTPAPAPAPAPAPQQANAQQAAQMQQMMTALNQQMQQLMATAANNPNAQQQMQMLMQQQQQLIQMMSSSGVAGGAAPAASAGPSPQQLQAQQQMQKKKADDDFAFAAQAMRQSMNKQ